MYDAVQGARDAGVNLAFMGANAAYWQVRFENADRVMVCYKDASIDPRQGPTTTVNCRDPLVNRPEQTLIGVQFVSDVPAGHNVPYVVTNSSHWIYAGTGFKDGDTVPGIVGYEMDRFMSEYPAPPGTNRTLLSHSPFTNALQLPDYANSSIYQAPSGAWVFGSGTLSWNWGLDDYYHNATDPRIQRTTANLLDAFINGAPVVDHFAVTGPASGTAGQAFNVATGYRGTVHFTSSDALATLPTNYTFSAADAGVHQFSVTLVTPTVPPLLAKQTISVNDTANAALHATSAPITVNPVPGL